jgi:hypothetical protein
VKKTLLLNKMVSETGFPVRYYLDGFNVNFLLGRRVSLKYEGDCCLYCKSAQDIFRQGFCRSCFFDRPQTDEWVIRPELSKAHLGIESRDLEFEKKMQLQPHIVYLTYSGIFKVGVTRKSQIPTRFIDQGSQQAIFLLEVPNRYLAGVAAVALNASFGDKTNWRTMLSGYESVDWDKSYNLFIDAIESNPEIFNLLEPYIIERKKSISNEIIIDYPYNSSRIKKDITSINLKKNNFNGILTGIKGQYLIFDNEYVLNIRSNEGKLLSFNFF